MNTPKRDSQWMGDLLGYSLGLSDAEDRQRIDAALPDANQRQRFDAHIRRVIAPLASDRIAPPPADLAARILDRVDRQTRTIKLPKLSTVAAGETGASRTSGAYMALREVVGLAASILLFVGILIPGLNSARLGSQRTACMQNMRSIGSGYVAYVENNGGSWPYVGPVPQGASWLATTESPQLRNSRHPFALVQGRYVQPRVFADPGRGGDIPLDPAFIEGQTDFPDPRNNGYSTSFVQQPWRGITFQANQPLVADMNPLVDDPTARTAQGPVNSLSHGPAVGQNVLRHDMSVRWSTTPTVGVDGDDIYRIIGVQRYTGLERPRTESDAFLIP